MNEVFADTLYWVAITNPHDPWRKAAERAYAGLGATHIVTTDEVLTEFLTAMAGSGEFLRKKAAQAVRRILRNANITVLSQSRNSFLDGLDLYEKRPDKKYSLTDCVSMAAMRDEGITDILTNDHHFEQEGFRVLIRK